MVCAPQAWNLANRVAEVTAAVKVAAEPHADTPMNATELASMLEGQPENPCLVQ